MMTVHAWLFLMIAELRSKAGAVVQLVRAAALVAGIAALAFIAGMTASEVFQLISYRLSPSDLPIGTTANFIQLSVFEGAQAGLGLFLVWPVRGCLLPRRLSFRACALACLTGFGIALFILGNAGPYVKALFTNAVPHTPTITQPMELLFGSLLLHNCLWMLVSIFVAGFAENLLYRGIFFKEADGLPSVILVMSSTLIMSCAYAFNLGLEGALLGLQLGLVLGLLRASTKSFVYSFLANVVAGVVDGTAMLLSGGVA